LLPSLAGIVQGRIGDQLSFEMGINDVENLLELHGETLTDEELIQLKEAEVSAVTQGETSGKPQKASKG